MAESTTRAKKKSLFELVGDLPTLVRELVRGEIELLKTEIIGKLKTAGIGVALIAVAAVVLLLFVGVLLTAAILALSLVMPGWLAALVVAFALLIVIGILVLVGYRAIKKAMPPLPEQAIDSLKRDVRVIRGVGKMEDR